MKTRLILTLVGFVLATILVACVSCKPKVGATAGTGPAVTQGAGNADTTEVNGTATDVPPVDPTVVPEGKACVDGVGHEYPDGYKYAVGTKDNATHFECRDGQFVELPN